MSSFAGYEVYLRFFGPTATLVWLHDMVEDVGVAMCKEIAHWDANMGLFTGNSAQALLETILKPLAIKLAIKRLATRTFYRIG